jgi:predicted nucleic acid-binding protein
MSGRRAQDTGSGHVATAQSSRVAGVSCLIDTDVAIDFLRRRSYARILLDYWAGKGLLAISSLTHLEIYRGMKTGEEAATAAFLDGLISVSVDIQVARRAGILLRELPAQGTTAGIADAIIAATALQLGAPLLTNNVERYPFTGVRLIRGTLA